MVNSTYFQVKPPYGKSKQMLLSVVRSTSCNSGWLRLVVQGIFCFIIVCSFLMITIMTIHSHYQNVLRERRRCIAQNCRVRCNYAPFFEDFELNILQAIKDTESDCSSVVLTLNNPMFVNSTLPGHWLSAIRVEVSDLEIVGGNLKHIPPDAFQTQFGGNIKVLVLEKITITRLAADTFIGLSSLEKLFIKDCEIINIRRSALQAVDDTLQVLNIRTNNKWDPVNITGSSDFEQLRVVDFSMNKFDDVLGSNSFTELKYCKVLFLNSCNIISIGAGAFDYLDSIQVLYLNNNYLVSLPNDIFNKIIPREPRIGLHENLWNCSCNNNLRILFKLGLLIVEPTCHFPLDFRGEKMSSFEKHCQDDPKPTLIDENLFVFGGKSVSTLNHQCSVNSSIINYAGLESPLLEFECQSNIIDQQIIKHLDQSSITDIFSPENNWLKPSFSIDSSSFSMVTLVFSGPYDYGLMWYHTKCPKVIYCINHLPRLLRVYNEDLSTDYTFCRIFTTPTGMQTDQCVAYTLSNLQRSNINIYKSVILIVAIAIISLLTGALCVYGLIHKHPIILKGNKRVVFVKHKTVDALILPAKTYPSDKISEGPNKSNVFIVSRNNTYLSERLSRANSVRTNDSNDPSYITALQPTEDQLAEWRTRSSEAMYANDTSNSNLAIPTQMVNTALTYYSYDATENIYDTIKSIPH